MTELDSITNNLIDAILTLGNHPALIKIIEPQVMQPLQLEKWMVVRTLTVLALMEDEFEKATDV